MAVGFAVPAGVPVLVVPLPVAGVFVVTVVPVVLVPLFVPPFAGVPLEDPLPLVAGVEEGLGPGREVTGVGTSGIGFDKTFATSSVTLASVAVLLRYLYSAVSSVTIPCFLAASVVKAAARAIASI